MKKTSYTVLVIEDEPDIRELIEFNLKKYHYNVLLASNGEKGLKDARSYEPDLILLDLMLPGIQGIDVCRVIILNIAFNFSFYLNISSCS